MSVEIYFSGVGKPLPYNGMMKLLADTMPANNRKVIGVFTKLLPKVNSAVVFSYDWNLFSVTE